MAPTLKRKRITPTRISNATVGRGFKSARLTPSASSILRRISAEKKEKEQLFTPNLYYLTAGTQAYIYGLCQIGQGTDVRERIGRKIRHNSVSVKVMVAPRSTMTNADCGFMAIILDRQPNGTLATFDSMYDSSFVPGNFGLAHRHTTINQERFKVLWTKTWTCPNFANADATMMNEFIDLTTLKGFDATCNYSDTGSGSASINSGQLLFVVAQTNDAQTVSSACNFRADVKYRFTDV